MIGAIVQFMRCQHDGHMFQIHDLFGLKMCLLCNHLEDYE